MKIAYIVDDEILQGRQLAKLVQAEGYNVSVFTAGSEVIAAGLRNKPDLLITDWMLRDNMDGLKAARVLRAIHPQLPCILVTGFGSDDHRVAAARGGVDGYVEKPIDPANLKVAITEVVNRAKRHTDQGVLRVAGVGGDERLVALNAAAEEWFAADFAETEPSIANLACDSQSLDWEYLASGWRFLRLQPTGKGWWVRALRPEGDDNWLLVLGPGDHAGAVHNDLLAALSGSSPPMSAHWRFTGRVVFISADPNEREEVVDLVESAGGVAYTAPSLPMGRRLWEADPGLTIAVVPAAGGADPAQLVQSFREKREGARIILTVKPEERQRFADCGADGLLNIGVLGTRLLQEVTGQIGPCVECGIWLPLLHGETVERWHCAFCGSVYRAVADPLADESKKQNAIPS